MKIVFDIDGVLADPSHRLHYIQQEPKNWEMFFAECIRDAPIKAGVELFYTVERGSRYIGMERYNDISLWTGRPERVRVHTKGWLAVNMYRADSMPLIMRADDDHRPDHEVKADFIKKHGKPDLVFEDRKSVVDMYRSHGILVAHMAEGNF